MDTVKIKIASEYFFNNADLLLPDKNVRLKMSAAEEHHGLLLDHGSGLPAGTL